MTTIYDVNTNDLIEKAAVELKKIKEMAPPEWAMVVKTGVHKQRPPANKDWWHVRCASILRTIYLLGPIGTAKLRTRYGGKKRRGYQPPTFKKGSGSIIRKALQQLEKSGLILQTVKKGHKGRVVTPKGKSFLDKIASLMVQHAPKKEEQKHEEKKAELKEEKPKHEEKKAEEKPKAEEKKPEAKHEKPKQEHKKEE